MSTSSTGEYFAFSKTSVTFSSVAGLESVGGRLGQERPSPNSLPAVEAGRLSMEPHGGALLAVLACTFPARCMPVQPTAMHRSDERQRDSPVLTGALIGGAANRGSGRCLGVLLRPVERRSSVWPSGGRLFLWSPLGRRSAIAGLDGQANRGVHPLVVSVPVPSSFVRRLLHLQLATFTQHTSTMLSSPSRHPPSVIPSNRSRLAYRL